MLKCCGLSTYMFGIRTNLSYIYISILLSISFCYFLSSVLSLWHFRVYLTLRFRFPPCISFSAHYYFSHTFLSFTLSLSSDTSFLHTLLFPHALFFLRNSVSKFILFPHAFLSLTPSSSSGTPFPNAFLTPAHHSHSSA